MKKKPHQKKRKYSKIKNRLRRALQRAMFSALKKQKAIPMIDGHPAYEEVKAIAVANVLAITAHAEKLGWLAPRRPKITTRPATDEEKRQRIMPSILVEWE